MKSKRNCIDYIVNATVLLPATILSIGLTALAPEVHASIVNPEEVIVTARRTEEAIQTVPISMTVFNQQMLNERNVTNGSDLANYTPSLSVSTRFGADNTTFAIRGFTQELRTSASVAVYFADVVAPRGGSQISAGDGAGPGSFFDLQDVQVLKGPQGTLFGRNTTGGAVVLVPREPTNRLEGYVEGSAGNYGMRRYQGVLNVPFSDSLRGRFGIDTQKRDGYLVNVTDIGPNRLADVHYFSGRASLMWDISDSVSNYTIYTYAHSRNHNTAQKLYTCNQGALPALVSLCNDALQRAGNGYYNVTNEYSDSLAWSRQQQLINTTTWDVNDNFSIKNILAAADLLTYTRFSNMAGNLQLVSGDPSTHIWLFPAGTKPGVPTTAQRTYVEELRFSGVALDENLNWQAGLYYERSRPNGISGAQQPSYAVCNPGTGDLQDYRCTNVFPGGGVASNLGTIEYINKAVYGQGTYDITDEFRFTLGARYTDDTTHGDSRQTSYTFDPVTGIANGSNCVVLGADPNNECSYRSSQHSEAPTWVVDFDYLPTPDAMYYAKYSRGYRQGSVSIASPAGYQSFQPEKVDAYEIGMKLSLRGPIRGTFNLAGFYNELTNQQLQVGEVPCALAGPNATCTPAPAGFAGSATTAIVNAGASRIQGIDADTVLLLTRDLTFNLSYTYLSTRLDSLTVPPGAAGYAALPAAVQGGHLSFSPTHSLSTGLSYRLPIPADWGQASIGGSYSFISDQISTVDSHGTLPCHQLVNLNAGWKAVFGSPFDVSWFMTNALNKEYPTYNPGVYDQLGMGFQTVGEPRMWGARVRYNFE